MARSIGDWFKDHSDSSLGDRLDDEVVKRQEPWDRAVSGRSTSRADRKAAGFGTRRRRGVERSAKSPSTVSAVREGSTATKNGKPQKPSQPIGAPPDLETRIGQAAKAHPDLGYKRLARLLRESGFDVTRAQVAQVLAHPNSFWKRRPARRTPTSKSATVFRVTAGAQRSRIVPTTDLCTSCGVRLSVIGTCRCS